MIVLDVEASGLSPDSYPIEVAWQHRHKAECDSFLIKPKDDWTHWDQYAELHIHHITRTLLLEDGITVRDAAKRLNQHLANQYVYTDSIDYDRGWIKRLFKAAEVEMKFKILCVYSLIDPGNVETFKRKQAGIKTEHRALSDARNLVNTLNYFDF